MFAKLRRQCNSQPCESPNPVQVVLATESLSLGPFVNPNRCVLELSLRLGMLSSFKEASPGPRVPSPLSLDCLETDSCF